MLGATGSRIYASCQRASCSYRPFPLTAFSTTAPSCSGSNKWSKIRHKKAANDSARSQSYGVLSREIIAAIRTHPTRSTSTADNARLSYLLKKARELDVPNSKVEATLKKASAVGSGGDKTAVYEVVAYLGKESQPVSLVLECTTDGSNRTHAKVKESIHKYGAKLSSTMHLFTRRGTVRVLLPIGSTKTFEDIWEAAVELGAEEVLPWEQEMDEEGGEDGSAVGRIGAEIHCEPSEFQTISKALAEDPNGLEVIEAESKLVPSGAPLRVREEGESTDDLGDAAGYVLAADIEKLDKLVEVLEEEAECQRVWSNLQDWPSH